MTRTWFALLLAVSVSAVSGMRSTVSSQVNAACTSNMDTGRKFMEDGNYDQAINDFNQVIRLCELRDRRAEAVLHKGQIYLARGIRGFKDAAAAADELTSTYLNTPSGARGYVLKGRIKLQDTRDFQGALDEFTRVTPGVTKAPEVFAETLYWSGEAHRLNHQPEQALRLFADVALRYPETIWAARAMLGSAYCQSHFGLVTDAMETLQRVRRQFPEYEEAKLALHRNMLLYRLLQSPAPFAPTQVMTAGKISNGVALSAGSDDQLLVAYKDGLTIVRTGDSTTLQTPQMSARVDADVSAVGLKNDTIALARGFAVVFSDPAVKALEPRVPRPNEQPEYLEILSLVSTWRGEWIFGDDKSKSLLRFAPDGTYSKVVARNLKPIRIAQNDLDDIAVLDGDSKNVIVYDRRGEVLGEIRRRDPGDKQWEFDSPTDVAFDALGNYYVLDSGRATIHIFDPRRQYKVAVPLPQKGPEAVRKAVALAVDRRGRIYVLDKDRQQVIGYQ